MKLLSATVVLLALLLAAGGALATTVNFSSLVSTQDITISAGNPVGVTLDGVTFRYDDFGSGVDFASIDPYGVFGTTGGALLLDFSEPALGLNLAFQLLGYDGAPGDSLFAVFTRNSNLVGALGMAGASDDYGDVLGVLSFGGPVFDQATIFFSVDAPFFLVSELSYLPVPEPGTSLLLLAGCAGIACYRRFRPLV